MNNDWPLFEVFIRSRAGLEHKHVGSVHAADARMAIEHARDVYTRRQEGVSIWVVPSAQLTASDPGEAEALFEPARDKIYRHPTFYEIPEEVKNLWARARARLRRPKRRCAPRTCATSCASATRASCSVSAWVSGSGMRRSWKRIWDLRTWRSI